MAEEHPLGPALWFKSTPIIEHVNRAIDCEQPFRGTAPPSADAAVACSRRAGPAAGPLARRKFIYNVRGTTCRALQIPCTARENV